MATTSLLTVPDASLLNELYLMQGRCFDAEHFLVTNDLAVTLNNEIGLPDLLLTLQRRSTEDERHYIVTPGMPGLFSAFGRSDNQVFRPDNSPDALMDTQAAMQDPQARGLPGIESCHARNVLMCDEPFLHPLGESS